MGSGSPRARVIRKPAAAMRDSAARSSRLFSSASGDQGLELQRLRRGPLAPYRRQRQEEEEPGDPSANPQSFFDAIT
jgi:hypothetical protein